jgi:hypothetical protein
MTMRTILSGLALALAVALPQAHAETIIPVDEDVMTSGFFTGTNPVRGYAGDGRPVHRVSTDAPFGTVAAETVYLTFDFDFASLGGPVPKATLYVESVSGGFGADATVDAPFLMSAHNVTADPLSSITDDTNPTGPISYVDFFANDILLADEAARTTVTGFGTLEFDVTQLVNRWITGASTVHAIALTGKHDTSGLEFLHGIANDSETPGVSHFLSVVPEPSSVALAWAIGASAVAAAVGRHLASRRRQRRQPSHRRDWPVV